MATDVRGIEFQVGQQVARAAKQGRLDGLFVQVCTVTRVEGDRVFLDNSNRALLHPDRVAVLQAS